MSTVHSSSNPRIAGNIFIAVVVVLLSLFVGRLMAGQPLLAVAVASVPVVIMLVFRSPAILFCVYTVLLFDCFGWFPADDLLRIPGLGKLTDLIGLAMFVSFLISVLMRQECVSRLKLNPYYKPILIMAGYAAWILVYTICYWDRDVVLALRTGRSFLIYGLPLFGFVFLKNERQWRALEWLCLLAIWGTFLSNFVELVADIPWLDPFQNDAGKYGVFKSYARVKFLTTLFVARYLWCFVHAPSRKNFLLLCSVTVPYVFYIFRGLVVGLMVGLFVMTFFMSVRIRAKSYLLLFLGGSVAVFSAVFLAAIISGVEIEEMVYQFTDEYIGQVGQDSSFEYRVMKIQERLPLFREHPLFGIGALSPMSPVAWRLYLQGYMPLGDIDSGWLDVLMRLGSIGALVYAWFYFVVIRRVGIFFQHYHKVSGRLSLEDQAWMMGVIVVIVQVLVTLVSSANITFPPTVAVVSIGLIKCMKIWEEQKALDIEQRSAVKGQISVPEENPLVVNEQD